MAKSSHALDAQTQPSCCWLFCPVPQECCTIPASLKGASMARFGKYSVLLSVLLLTFCIRHPHTAMAGNPPPEGKEVVLKAADITPKIFPERVFFRGQSAPVQFRNSGGVPFADDLYVLAGMGDSSPSSTPTRQKYHASLLNQATLQNRWPH